MFKGEVMIGEKTFSFVVPNHNTAAEYKSEAQLVSLWMKAGEHMIPKEPEKILGLFEMGHSVLIYSGNWLIGHGAITEEWPSKNLEIGSIIVSPSHRHEGAGTAATLATLAVVNNVGWYKEWTKFALANDISAKMLEKLGATKMMTAELPDEVFELCKQCPLYKVPIEGQVFTCCDTPYNLAPIMKQLDKVVMKWEQEYMPVKQYADGRCGIG